MIERFDRFEILSYSMIEYKIQQGKSLNILHFPDDSIEGKLLIRFAIYLASLGYSYIPKEDKYKEIAYIVELHNMVNSDIYIDPSNKTLNLSTRSIPKGNYKRSLFSITDVTPDDDALCQCTALFKVNELYPEYKNLYSNLYNPSKRNSPLRDYGKLSESNINIFQSESSDYDGITSVYMRDEHINFAKPCFQTEWRLFEGESLIKNIMFDWSTYVVLENKLSEDYVKINGVRVDILNAWE